ncbi:hypothetical protein VB716_07210 [Synechococcus sp. CCY9201]|uniref:hypothetical protein n=1 Tax=Synechococcus sp. CCY9201 TaxID=174697 RepID=UPI002B21F4EC|nr:hypothetical protein [Synechococcus sp. CCY9201]MEA5474011.1 hypothetical protein [Synechococcus sp. CCY9201]
MAEVFRGGQSVNLAMVRDGSPPSPTGSTWPVVTGAPSWRLKLRHRSHSGGVWAVRNPAALGLAAWITTPGPPAPRRLHLPHGLRPAARDTPAGRSVASPWLSGQSLWRLPQTPNRCLATPLSAINKCALVRQHM